MKYSLLASVVASIALVTASPAVAGKQNIQTLDAPVAPCDLGLTTPDASDCAGYYAGNLINGSPTDLQNQADAIAMLDGDFEFDTSSSGIDFTSAILTGPGGPYELMEEFDNGISEFWNLSDLFLDAGTYMLTINGNNSSTGSLGGTVTINATPAVPEPGTWAMMLMGFGAAGYAMRRRRAPVLAQMA